MDERTQTRILQTSREIAQVRAQQSALELAIQHCAANEIRASEEAVLDIAERFALWLGNPVMRLVIRPESMTYPQPHAGGKPAGTVFQGGIVELKDTKQVRLNLDVHDWKGVDTAEPAGVQLSWSTDDPGVVSIQPSEDGLSCLAVAGVPGSCMVQISDGTRTGSLAFDVTPGDVSAISIVAGEPEDQPGVTP